MRWPIEHVWPRTKLRVRMDGMRREARAARAAVRCCPQRRQRRAVRRAAPRRAPWRTLSNFLKRLRTDGGNWVMGTLTTLSTPVSVPLSPPPSRPMLRCARLSGGAVCPPPHPDRARPARGLSTAAARCAPVIFVSRFPRQMFTPPSFVWSSPSCRRKRRTSNLRFPRRATRSAPTAGAVRGARATPPTR